MWQENIEERKEDFYDEEKVDREFCTHTVFGDAGFSGGGFSRSERSGGNGRCLGCAVGLREWNLKWSHDKGAVGGF